MNEAVQLKQRRCVCVWPISNGHPCKLHPESSGAFRKYYPQTRAFLEGKWSLENVPGIRPWSLQSKHNEFLKRFLVPGESSCGNNWAFVTLVLNGTLFFVRGKVPAGVITEGDITNCFLRSVRLAVLNANKIISLTMIRFLYFFKKNVLWNKFCANYIHCYEMQSITSSFFIMLL